MVAFIELEVLLRIFLDYYDSLSAMPIKFPASVSQMTPAQNTPEQKGFKKTCYEQHLFFQNYFCLSDFCYE